MALDAGGEVFAAVHETHIGVVFLVGERAYKLKKPVTTGFLDFGTREKRLAACRREAQLNRRLAPDVYLGVADVTEPDGGCRATFVVMRRMPEAARLSTLVRRGDRLNEEVRAIALRLIAAFHAGATRGAGRYRPWAVVMRCARDGPTASTRSSTLPGRRAWTRDGSGHRIEATPHNSLPGRPRPLVQALGSRTAWIVDGHGDLLADDIFCLDDGPRILDGLEFDDRLRWGDVLYDVGFLAMDLERLGRVDLADAFLDWYRSSPPRRTRSRSNTTTSPIGRWCGPRSRASKGASTTRWRPVTTSLPVRRHLLAGRVQLVVVGGLPGTGKTTLAAAVGDELGWSVLPLGRDPQGARRARTARTRTVGLR